VRSENECGCISYALPEQRICLCPTMDIAQVIGRKYTMSLIGIIGNHGKIRFDEIKGRVIGISSSTLAMRLKELKAAGLIERTVYPEVPPRVEYSLTGKGKHLRKLAKDVFG